MCIHHITQYLKIEEPHLQETRYLRHRAAGAGAGQGSLGGLGQPLPRAGGAEPGGGHHPSPLETRLSRHLQGWPLSCHMAELNVSSKKPSVRLMHLTNSEYV